MKYSTKTKIKKWTALLLLTLLAAVILMIPAMGAAMAEAVVQPESPAELLSWEFLLTTTGCAFAVGLIVQSTKGALDKLVKIPTTLYAYVIAVVTLLLATWFTGGLTLSNALLTLFNGWIVSATASKSFDVITGK